MSIKYNKANVLIFIVIQIDLTKNQEISHKVGNFRYQKIPVYFLPVARLCYTNYYFV